MTRSRMYFALSMTLRLPNITGRRLLVAVVLLLAPLLTAAQEENKDLKDVIRKWRKDSTGIPSPELQIGKNYISVLPVIGYAPANGFVIGSAISITRLVDKTPTNPSVGLVNLQLTSKKQFIINARSKIYLKDNVWFLQGDWRILFFAQPTYGLGINNTGANKFILHVNGLETETSPIEQPMRFNYFRFYEDVVRKIGKGHWYVGAGVAIDKLYSIKDERLDLDSSDGTHFYTSHYGYSTYYGFSTENYSTTGFNINVLTDTRDNVANTYKGYFASVSFRFNPDWWGSDQQSTMASYDLRYYWGLSKKRPRHVLAFWSYGNFVTSGNVPYLTLPSIGWDTYNKSGRGYIQGRYRGLDMIYNEAEYRFPLSKNNFIGGVAFVNVTLARGLDVNSSTLEVTEQKLFDKAAPAGGIGMRLQMDKTARVNLSVDLGVGADKSSGIYFNLQETF
jgi:hypothetical protein